jgi:hypothetical protein
MIARGEIQVRVSRTDDRVLSMSEVAEALSAWHEFASKGE